MVHGVLRKNAHSPPFIISQYTYKFAKYVFNGYEMVFQGEKDECINYLNLKK
jgi:hypothetical protein